MGKAHGAYLRGGGVRMTHWYRQVPFGTTRLDTKLSWEMNEAAHF